MRLVLVFALLGLNAFAVRTKECPELVRVKASGFNITRDAEAVVGNMEPWVEQAEKDAVRKAFKSLSDSDGVPLTLPLETKKGGRCTYRNRGSMEKIELYSEKKTDKLMMQTEVGPRGILLRVYAKLESIEDGRVSAVSDSGKLALAIPRYPFTSYNAGGPLEFIGTADEVTASATK